MSKATMPKQNSAPILFGLPDKATRFDLPLHTRLGTEFLVMLLALMTSLCLLTVVGCISLAKMADNWQGNLKNALSIEIPYGDQQDEMTDQILEIVIDHPAVKSAETLGDEALSELLKPWLGSLSAVQASLPMPSIIAVELKTDDPEKINDLTDSIQKISDKISLDGHDEWLDDLAKLINGVQIIALILLGFISVVTFFTVGGAVRSRMAIHQTELELLHIMGAHDKYIRGQFQKYILILAGKGIVIGSVATLLLVAAISLISAQFPATIPHLTLYPIHILSIPIVAMALILISLGSARHTVNHVLKEIP